MTNKRGSKLIAWLLVLVMTLGMLPLEILADTEGYEFTEFMNPIGNATVNYGKTAEEEGGNTYDLYNLVHIYNGSWYRLDMQSGGITVKGELSAYIAAGNGKEYVLPDSEILAISDYSFSGKKIVVNGKTYVYEGDYNPETDDGCYTVKFTNIVAQKSKVGGMKDKKAGIMRYLETGSTFTQYTGTDEVDSLHRNWEFTLHENMTVTYKRNGNVIKEKKVPRDSTITLASINAPANSGKKFVGWYEPVAKKTFNAGQSYKVTKDVTFEAKFTDPLTITFNDEERKDTSAINRSNVAIDEMITLPGFRSDRDGYYFTGWVVEGSTKLLPAGTEYQVKQNTVFAAQYGKGPTLTFDLNGGSGDVPAAITEREPGDVTVPAASVQREGYTFLGWADVPNHLGLYGGNYIHHLYQAGENYTLTKDTTLYAAWSKANVASVQYGIRLDGKIPDEPANYPVTEYSSHIYKNNVTINTQAWVVDTVGNAVAANLNYTMPTDEEIKRIYPSYDPATQYVQWYVLKWVGGTHWHVDGVVKNKNLVTLTYMINASDDSSVSNMPCGYQVAPGTSVTVGADGKADGTVKTPTRTGFTFKEWNTQANGKGTNYKKGESLTVDKKDVILYAQWSNNGLNLDVTGWENIYDGASHGLTVTTTVNGEPVKVDTIEYSNDNGASWSTTAPSVKNVDDADNGTWKVRAKKTGYETRITNIAAVLKVNPRAVTLTSEGGSKTYDGTALTKPEVTVSGDGFVSGEVSEIKATGSVTNVAEGEVTNAITYTENASFKADNYSITKNEGKLWITKATMTVSTTGHDDKYDGETHSATATASVTEETTISYSIDGGANWTAEAPKIKDVGTINYIVKATNANYEDATASGTLTVTPKAVTVTADNKTISFKDPAPDYTATVSGTLGSDTVSYTLSCEYKDKDKVGSYEITATGNEDQGNYKVTFKSGTLTVSNAGGDKINIVPDNYNGEYDGEPHTFGFTVKAHGQEVTDYEVQYSERDKDNWTSVKPTQTDVGLWKYKIRVTVPGYDTVTDQNVHINITPAKITLQTDGYNGTYDGEEHSATVTTTGLPKNTTLLYSTDNGENWTAEAPKIKDVGTINYIVKATNANYKDATASGTLTITKRTVTLKSADLEKTYDGKALVNGNTALATETGWVSGEGATYTFTGSQQDPGESANAFSYRLNDGTKAANYDITKTEGTLTVKKIETPIIITAASKSKTYDGSALTNDGYTYTEGVLAEGDELTAKVDGTITDYGTTANKVTSYQVKRGETDVTANYTFGTSVDGTLEITKRTVTLKSADLEKTYDGKALVNGNTALATETGWVSGEGATYTFTGSQQDPGESANAFTYTLNEGTKAANYDITKTEGTLTVKKIETPIIITAASESKTYDGSALTNDGYTYTKGVLAEGDELTAKVDGTITDYGTTANKVTSYQVKRGETDVTANYTFGTSVDGTLEITKRTVTLKSADLEKTYDGKALVNGNTALATETGWVSGEGATYTFTGSQQDPGESANTFTYTLNEGTKAANYDITKTEGTLTVKKIETPIIITAASDSKTYDGSALTNDGYTYTEGVLAEGDELTAKVDGTITDYGTTANKVTSYQVKRGGTDVTANYTFGTSVDGTLEITKRTVTLKSADLEKTYDGKVLVNGNTALATETGWVSGEGATYTFTGSQQDPGESANTFTYTLNEGTKAANYDITKTEGTLTVKKIETPIIITAASDSKTYDGSALTNDSYTYTEGVLAEGDVLTAKVEGTITDYGTAANKVTGYQVMRGETDVTANYTFGESVDGELAISKRNVTLTSEDGDKIYDGSALTKPNVAVTGDGFVDGEVSDIKATGTVTNVADGTKINTIAYTEGTAFKAENYTITKHEGKLFINPASVTVTANEQSKEVGQFDPALTAKVEGLVNGESETLITYTVSRQPGETQGTYTITPAGGEKQGNYTVTYKTGTMTITYNPTQATVKVVWDDANNQDGTRPASVLATLSNGNTVTLNEGNDWSATVNDLPIYINNESAVYTWTEGNVTGGYTQVSKTTSGTTTTITYQHTPDTTASSTVSIVWVDQNNVDGLRPASVTATLMANGNAVRTETVSGTWRTTVNNLPAKENGADITYTWDGEEVTGYTKTVSGNTITYTHEVEMVNWTIVNVWENGEAPAVAVTAVLNGGAAQTVTLNAANGWQSTMNVPKKSNGQDIAYAWLESVPSGYELVSSVTENTTTTNTYRLIPKTEPTDTDQTVTINYRDTEGNELRPTETRTYKTGDSYTVDAPAIEGYKAVSKPVSGVVGNRNVGYIVTYKTTDSDEETTIIEDYGTPLGLGDVHINVGVSFE